MKKIAGYYRLSAEDNGTEAESNSITNQRMLIKRYVAQDAELSSYEYCEFCDDGYSGTTMNRPGMQKLLESIKNNEIFAVIVKDISRFSRDYIELGTYMEQIFPFIGVRFIAIADCYDSRTHNGCASDMDIAFKALLADFYCKDVSVKVKSSLEARRRQGKYSTGLVPFGYAKAWDNPYRLVIVPEEAEIVRYIFQLSVQGNGLTQICRRLNNEGIMTPSEYKNLRKGQNRKKSQRETRLWQAGTVRTILTNESYIGSMVYDKTEQTAACSAKRKAKPVDEWRVFKKHHEPIIEKDIFDAVQTKYSSKISRSSKSTEYPLKGKLICGHCGRKLKPVKSAGGRLHFICPNEGLSRNAGCMTGYISNEMLEKTVLNEIRQQLAFLADKSIIIQELSLLREAQIKTRERKLDGFEKRLHRLGVQRAALLESYHAGELDREQFSEQSGKLAEIIKAAKAEYEAEKENAGVIKEPKELLREQPDCLTREMAEAFVEHVEADGSSGLDIYLTFNNRNAAYPFRYTDEAII